MLKLVTLLCLCSLAYCGDHYDMLTPIDVEDEEWCKTGYYQDPSEPCCFYYHCEEDKLHAYHQTCHWDADLYWNKENCACDWTWTPGACNASLNHLCVNEKEPIVEECWAMSPDECCLHGVSYDNHQHGFGPLYRRDSLNHSKYYIPDWHEYGYCPEPGFFSLKFCACTHLNTTCSCSHWDFNNPDPLLDDGTHMSGGDCIANGDGRLVCPVDANPVPAEIPATQKAYFGRTATIFGMVDLGFQGVVVTNGDPNLKEPVDATIVINIQGFTISVWLEYWNIEVHHTVTLPQAAIDEIQNVNGRASKLSFYVVIENGVITVCFGVSLADGTCIYSTWSEPLPAAFILEGSKCPLKLGTTRPATYLDFGYCYFPWSAADFENYCAAGIVPENPNPTHGSWSVFVDPEH